MTKKTVVTIACCFVGILVLILVLLWLLSIVNKKYFTYQEVETKMVKAAEDYYKKNPNALPVSDGKSTLEYQTLVDAGVIKPLADLLKDGESCNAEVLVIKDDNDYSYIPKLSCSDKYSTLSLSDKILKDNPVVLDKKGLYADNNGGYYFRGKVDNNFVAFGVLNINSREPEAILWRIISINNDNSIRMVATQNLSLRSKFDNRYNELTKSTYGYNDFDGSLIKDKLKSLEKDSPYFSESRLHKLVKTNLCIGTRTDNDYSVDGSSECLVKSEDKYAFDLIKQYEFIRTSLDPNCINQTDLSCQNENYLFTAIDTSWTLSPGSESHLVYYFNGVSFEEASANTQNDLYLVVTLSPYSLYLSGDGTEQNPYKLVFNE